MSSPSANQSIESSKQLISSLMSRNVCSAPVSSTAEEAASLAHEQRVHHLLVVDGEDAVGIVCLCNTERAHPSEPIAKIMKTPFVFVCPDWPVERVAQLVQRIRVGFLPVVGSDGRILGVVTRRDLRRAGALPAERGVDLCAACGSSHELICSSYTGGVAFCRSCLDQVRGSGVEYVTLGGEG